MRLINKNNPIVGGRYYVFSDDKGREYRVNAYVGTWNQFYREIRQKMANNGIQPPENLEELVEDQICQRQPEGACSYKGLGDKISQAIHTFASVVDKVAGTQLQKKARGCSSCGKRRVKLNNL